MTIHPALLETELDSFVRRLTAVSKFIEDVDVDVVDWDRTENKTLSAKEYLSVPIDVDLHFDLMMDTPSKAFDSLLSHDKVRTVCINLASKEDINDAIKIITEAGKFAGISANPDTSYEIIEQYLPLVEFVQIMTIVPGKQGSEFLPSQLDVVRKIAESDFNGMIGIDGGVNVHTIPDVERAPVNLISVGSAIVKADDPKTAYDELNRMINADGGLHPDSGV